MTWKPGWARFGGSTAHGGSASKKSLFACEQERGDVALARWLWFRDQKTLDPSKLVFVDEMGAATDLVRRYGWAPIGERLIGRAPHGHWKTSTFVAGLRQGGIVAPCCIDHPMNAMTFKAWTDQFLVPTLSAGDVRFAARSIMDNLSSHKGEAVRKAIESTGAELLFLPPYSPDLNPIEQAFAKLKHWLRRAAKRTTDDLWDEFGRILDSFTPNECANLITNSEYRST